ncbi:hypothetical protein BRDID11002_75460 [Bradyrhizobium diazoefficiens]
MYRPAYPSRCPCHPTAPARIIAVKKRYEKAEDIATPTAIIGQQQSMPMTNHTGLQGRGFKHLLPMGDLRFDFEMNLMFFQPGVCFPAVETHIMEHGLFMLEGQGLYYLGNSWHEIWVDDFIWMGSFCPQQFYPHRPEPLGLSAVQERQPGRRPLRMADERRQDESKRTRFRDPQPDA